MQYTWEGGRAKGADDTGGSRGSDDMRDVAGNCCDQLVQAPKESNVPTTVSVESHRELEAIGYAHGRRDCMVVDMVGSL